MRLNAVTGMVIDDALTRDTIIAALNKAGAEYESPPDEVTTESLATSLHLHYVGSLPHEQQTRCRRCKGISDDDDDVCPYCGCDQGDPILGSSVMGNGTTTEATKPMATVSGDVTQATTKLVKVNKTNGATIVDDTKPASALRSERDLDEAIRHVKDAMSASATNAWQLGRYIADIRDQDLWRLRTHKDEKTGKERPRWASWEAFCTTELGIVPRTALSFQNLAANFTADQIAAMGGTSKAALVLLAPPEARAEAKALAEQGATKREIAKHVKESRSKAKTPKAQTRTDKATEAAATKAATKAAIKASSTLTVANILGSVTVKLYKRPASMRGVELVLNKVVVAGVELERANKLADEPFGIHILDNGVQQLFAVAESSSGELIMKVVTKRDE
jgi:hypothetical protein